MAKCMFGPGGLAHNACGAYQFGAFPLKAVVNCGSYLALTDKLLDGLANDGLKNRLFNG